MVKQQSCVWCSKTFRTVNKAVAHIRQTGKQQWVKEISVNREFIDPNEIKFEDFKTEKSPREMAADERRAKANVPEAAVMYGQSGNAVNRDKEVLILEDGRFMRRKVSEQKKHLLSPFEPVVLNYVDEYIDGDVSEYTF